MDQKNGIVKKNRLIDPELEGVKRNEEDLEHLRLMQKKLATWNRQENLMEMGQLMLMMRAV